MTRSVRVLVYLMVFVFAAAGLARFFYDNPDRVRLYFWIWRSTDFHAGFLLTSIFLIGFGIASFLSLSSLVRRSFEVSRLKRENENLQRLLGSKQAELDAYSSSSKTNIP